MTINIREECDRLQQIVGWRDERIRQLEREIVDHQRNTVLQAREWVRLINHQKDLADYLIESVTNENGQIARPRMNAELEGELFIPCSFFRVWNGRRYRLELVSTEYEIQEVEGNE